MKVFISHSSKDKRFVRKLKDDLKENDISTWLDEDQMEPGDSLYDELEEGIENSSHFIIILSQHSIESDWVRNELKNALRASKKIIPIKYKKCEVPFEIKNLLYIDLSDEIVESKDDRVEFATKGYRNGLIQLINSLRTSDKFELTKLDKEQIQKEIEKPNVQKGPELLRIYLKVAGFTSIGKKRWNSALKEIGNKRPIPVLLPQIFCGFKKGDKLKVLLNNGESLRAHFAGYRKDNLKIVFPSILMRALPLEIHKIYAFEFDKNKKTISIL